MAWQRFAVQLKGEAEPIIVQTSARDWSNVTMDPGAPRALDMTFQVVHAALLRSDHDVPRDYRGFLEVLDGIPESLDDDTNEQLDPTAATRSDD
jgi:hypothetical protein